MSVFLESRLTQKSSEGDGRRQRGKVDEDDGSHALRVQSISDVAEVLRVAASHVFDQTSEQTAGPPQGLVAVFGGHEGVWEMRTEPVTVCSPRHHGVDRTPWASSRAGRAP